MGPQVIRVRFPGNARSFPFLLGDHPFRYGQKVVAMSDRGMAIGYINSFPYCPKGDGPQLRPIAKVATDADMGQEEELRDKEAQAERLCLELVEELGLPMTVTHVQYVQFGKKAVFYFTASERVDFRDLARKLSGKLRMRIELRQLSSRDRTAALGAIGVCGLQTCCSSFLKRYGQVNTKMAKNQNLSLLPSKINGVCGQIKCCTKYENEVYKEKRSRLPKEEDIIQTANGDIGQVYRLHVLVEQFEMITDLGAKRRYAQGQYLPDTPVPKGYQFPRELPHIVDETASIVGALGPQEDVEEDLEASGPGEGNGISDVVHAGDEGEQPLEPKPEA